MNLNPIILSIPIFFILIGIELIVERLSHRKLYRFQDTVANLSCGITSQMSGLFMRIFAVGVYEIFYEHLRLLSLDRNWIYWISLFFLVDLAYYWAHRMSHEINLFWGGHVVHHQSEDYNLSVALRQSSFQVVWTFAFSLPLAVAGFETSDFVIMSAFNTLYQFWIHTETINRMGWFEYIFNTPSHHRVHHGRNPKYIDKNHAGTLIIWDKMFRTFQREEERPVYGITTPVKSWNAVWANFSHYSMMTQDLRRINGLGDKVRYVFKKPGWLPKGLGGYRAAPDVDREKLIKYEAAQSLPLTWYVLFQYIVCIVVTSLFLFNVTKVNMIEKTALISLIVLWVVNCGVLFEHKPWVVPAEWIRIFVFPLGVIAAVQFLDLAMVFAWISAAYLVISGVWFYTVNKSTHDQAN